MFDGTGTFGLFINLRHLMRKEADIVIEGNQIVFKHPSPLGDTSFDLKPEDVGPMSDFLDGKGEYSDSKFGIYNDGFFTPGFKITLEGMDKVGEKLPALVS